MSRDGSAEAVLPGPPRPVLTLTMIGLFVGLFGLVVAVPAVPGPDRFDPSIQTLIAYGAMSGHAVIERGEWFRLLTAALLHAGTTHLAFNCLGMLVAGGTLEPIVGRLWLAALFVIGAIGGGLASIHWNAPGIVGVGASGAIMGLFGALAMLAFRFPKGPARRSFLTNALGALVPTMLPSLLPLVGIDGPNLDHAAHAGGAVAGALAGAMLVMIWPRRQFRPGWWPLAALIVLAGVAVLAQGVVRLAAGFDAIAVQSRLIPDSALPKTDEAAHRQADSLIARYPDDPRGYFYAALRLIRAGDFAGAELRAGEARERAERFRDTFLPAFRLRILAVLALIQSERGRQDEAIDTARPACGADGPDDIKPALAARRLCR